MSTLRTQERSLLQNLRNRLAFFGSNSQSGQSTLVAGSVVVPAPWLKSVDDSIFLTVQTLGTVTAPQAIACTAKTPGVSFTITSADNTDTSTVAWLLIPS